MIGPRLGTTTFDNQQLLVESDGFLGRAYANVFQAIDARKSEMHVTVRASCCEVYHEQVPMSILTTVSAMHYVPVITVCVFQADELQVSW